MRHILARNVNNALSTALIELIHTGERSDSRNGTVLRFNHPVLTEYTHPRERVVFSPLRNANPVFHVMESLWMLAGREDLAFVKTFVKRMADFSDDQRTLWGAYGFRWRNFFGYDQLNWIIRELRHNPSSRRCVLQMWNGFDLSHRPHSDAFSPPSDLYVATHGGRDVPCNTAIYFDTRGGALNMTITNRSNDAIWGAYGANAVHMSFLQEYVAAGVGLPLGRMWQFSNDLHVYTDVIGEGQILPLAVEVAHTNFYEAPVISDVYVTPAPLIAEGETREMLDLDLYMFFRAFDAGGLDAVRLGSYNTEFMRFVAIPMLEAWTYRRTDLALALNIAQKIGSSDWSTATVYWLQRNHGEKNNAQA